MVRVAAIPIALALATVSPMTMSADRVTGPDFVTRSEVLSVHGMAATSQPLATQVALGHMLPANYGSIINISSVEGKQGTAAMSVYCTAKHGLNGFTKAVAAEVGRQGVTVNAICPGLILTDAVTDGGPDLAAFSLSRARA